MSARVALMTLIFVVILMALVFEYINGFHDTANSIATVVATRVLTPRQAVVMAACTNLLGALLGTAVATTIASGLVDPKVASQEVLICACWAQSSGILSPGMRGCPAVRVMHWSAAWSGPPSRPRGAGASSSGRCLIAHHWYPSKGLLWKVIIPMFASPLLGFVLGFLVMGLLYALLRNWKPRTVNTVFGKAQMFSAMGMGLMHGTNDAQKTMGIVALALASGTAAGRLANLPHWLSFLHVATPEPGQSLTIALVDQSDVRAGHGGRNRRRRLADHQDARAQDGPASTGQWVRRRNKLGRHHRAGVAFRNPRIDDAQRLGFDHGRRRGQAVQRPEMDDRRTHGLGLAADDPSYRNDRLLADAVAAGAWVCSVIGTSAD